MAATSGYLPPSLALKHLVHAVTQENGLSMLRDLAPAYLWHHYWQLYLQTLVRKGTLAEIHPAHLLALAEEAAGLGALPMATPSRLRNTLHTWARDLRAQGGWTMDTPLWWEPLPSPGKYEKLWSVTEKLWQLEQEPLNQDTGFPGLVKPNCLPADFLETLNASLERAYADQKLNMTREGVGVSGHVSESRTDAVAYLDGTEPQLVEACPELAALIQWLLSQLPRQLSPMFDAPPLFAPARVMLTRYTGPTDGYRTHFDNPGGEHDNGREITFTLYLQSPTNPCNGGGLVIRSAETGEALREVSPLGGMAVAFASRKVPHQVAPLAAGAPRWTLISWLNGQPQHLFPPLPRLAPASLLLPYPTAPLPPDKVAFHQLNDSHPTGEITIQALDSRPRIGAVATVYGAHDLLPNWCEHHLSAGFDHLLLIFDHLEEQAEGTLAHKLSLKYGDRLTIWSGKETAHNHWSQLPKDDRLEQIFPMAQGGNSSQGVSARQMLNASAALLAAQKGELGHNPLQWLLHMDADELLIAETAARGGKQIPDCFAAAQEAGLHLLRFLNHEWLVGPNKNRYKINPRLAAARLGEVGWAEIVKLLRLAQDADRPWFTGYHNGKSAVSVGHGHLAAGVHGWYLQQQATEATAALLAGPHILHRATTGPESFAGKYLRKAAAEPESHLFAPSPVEEKAMQVIAKGKARGLSEPEIREQLEQLFAQLHSYAPQALDILEEAGCFFDAAL